MYLSSVDPFMLPFSLKIIRSHLLLFFFFLKKRAPPEFPPFPHHAPFRTPGLASPRKYGPGLPPRQVTRGGWWSVPRGSPFRRGGPPLPIRGAPPRLMVGAAPPNKRVEPL